MEDIEKGGRLLNIKKVGERKAIGDKTIFNRGDILYSKLRPYLLKILIAPEDGICTPEIIPFTCYGDICKDYIVNLLKSPYVDDYINSATFGVKMPRVSTETMTSLMIPLPPLSEQIRIAKKIESLIPYINGYGNAQDKLDKLNEQLRNDLRKSILQEAIQGKLVPQIASEGDASILLQQIEQEKQKLVKEGKLKQKDLVSSTIFRGDDNKYYEQIGNSVQELDTGITFPASWKILRLKDVCLLIDGEKRKGENVILDAQFLRGKSDGVIAANGKFVCKNDQIILVDGENSGEVFTVPCDGYMGSTFKQLWVSSELNLHYVLYFILFYKVALRNSKKGAAIPHLNKDIFYNLVIGIPPLQEQNRIVQKVDMLMEKCSN